MTATLVAVLALAALVVWFDARCLADLSRTSDAELRMFPRTTWALVIVFSFPIGPVLYLVYAKGGPRRFG
jgi:predicted CDP-diglyceride synthetase/phosphatidate cytidylyltransferase